jgi:hypothetical protein
VRGPYGVGLVLVPAPSHRGPMGPRRTPATDMSPPRPRRTSWRWLVSSIAKGVLSPPVVAGIAELVEPLRVRAVAAGLGAHTDGMRPRDHDHESVVVVRAAVVAKGAGLIADQGVGDLVGAVGHRAADDAALLATTISRPRRPRRFTSAAAILSQQIVLQRQPADGTLGVHELALQLCFAAAAVVLVSERLLHPRKRLLTPTGERLGGDAELAAHPA